MTQYTFADPETLKDPRPMLGALRQGQPVHFDEGIGMYVVTRYDDCVEAARQSDVFSNAAAYYPPNPFEPDLIRTLDEHGQGELARILIATDPPEHTRVRALVNKAFAAPRVARMAGQLDSIVNERIDAFIDRGEAELVSDLAIPVPANALADMLGLPREQLRNLPRWSTAYVDVIYSRYASREQAVQAGRDFAEYQNFLVQMIREQRRSGADNLATEIINATAPGYEPFSDQELLAIFVQFMNAGTVTTTDAITYVAIHLCRRPQDVALLRTAAKSESELARYVEEMLRIHPPQLAQPRVTLKATTLGGTAIPAGATVLLSWQSANLDTSVFERADEFDPNRRNAQRHLAFGHGIHTCIGNALARLEVKSVLRALTTRLDNLRFADPSHPYDVMPDIFLPKIPRLDVRFERADV